MWYHEEVRYKKGVPFRYFRHHSPFGPLHWHRQFEILYVVQGSILLKIVEEDKEYLLEQGEVMLINANRIHATYTVGPDTGDLTICGLQIDPAFCKDYFPDFERVVFDSGEFLSPDRLPDRRELASCMDTMLAELVNDRPAQPFLLNSLLNRMAFILIDRFRYTINQDVQRVPQKDLVRLKRIMGYVAQNYRRKITLDEVAQREHVSKYYLSHFFRDKAGVSFRDYVTSVRLENAARELLDTDAKVVDILLGCGFAEPKSFYKQFREKYGVTPSDYRSQHHLLPYDREASLDNPIQYDNEL